jgi:long-chain fatty acid transport protein
LPQDAAAAANNPAGLLKVGNDWEISAALFAPYRGYTVTGAPSGVPHTFGLAPGTVLSNDSRFLIPSVAWSRKLGDANALGVILYANGGLNTTYPAVGPGTGPFYGGAAGVNIEQVFLAPTYAFALDKRLSIGLSVLATYQTFRAGGLGNFAAFSSAPGALTDKGVNASWGIGGKVGVLYDVSSHVTVGAAYQSITSQRSFASYAGLFAQSGSFNVPATATLGFAWTLTPASVAAFDIEHISYGRIASVANPFANLFLAQAGNPAYALGAAYGPGFGWRDTTFYKLGYQQRLSPALTVRAGTAYGIQPVPSSDVLFNILAPGVTQWHYSLGATLALSHATSLDFALVDAPKVTVTGPNPLEVPGQQRITLGMNQYEVELGYGRKY